jgi:hypothetical protein
MKGNAMPSHPRLFVAAGLLSALAALSGAAAAQPAPRGEAAIREVILSNGTRRYAVPIKVGSVAIEAGLDTGSTGLRVLPGVLADADAKDGGHSETYSYGSGAELQGVAGEGVISIGGVSGPSSLQLVRRVGCVVSLPRCPASRVSATQYGVQGDGLPGEGFKAILGTNLSSTRIANPFVAIGVHRWIVELPRPGETAPGRIVLNPTDAEVADYTVFALNPNLAGRGGGLHDAIPGCLVNAATKAKACGAVMLDSGAPGLRLENAGLGSTPWREGADAILAFYDPAGHLQAAEALTIGRREQASRLQFVEEPRRQGTTIFSGLTVYFAYSVLYDADHQNVGLKARAPAAGGPKAIAPGP